MSKPTRRSPARRPPARKAGPRARAVAPPTPWRASLAGALWRLRQDPRWILLVLRAYLGVTFVYAGLSKVGNDSFLNAASPTSMHATVLAVRAQSPIGGLLGPVAHHSFAFGLLIALGETAVGTGLLLGLLTRIAAGGGMAISLSLFLTVSWGATPWYTGADIVYLFALTPLLLGGAGPLAADEWLAARRAADEGPDAVAADRGRRVIVTSLAAMAALLAVGLASVLRRSPSSGAAGQAGGASPSDPAAPTGTAGTSSPTGAAPGSPATGTPIVAAAGVPVGGAAPATDPKTGDPIYVLQLQPGVYTAIDRVCPHQGCEVTFLSASAGFECPCHLSTFAPSGAVTRGPAPTGLTPVPVAKSGSEIVRT